MNLPEIIAKILDFLYYRTCYICAKKCADISLCEDCLDKIYSNMKFRKANKFGTTIFSAAPYENELLKIIRALKYHKKKEFKKVLADLIISIIENYNLDLKDFIVCPVPIHKNRFKRRKYNHMELVAQEVAKRFDLELDTSLLTRIKDTAPLYKLTVQERKEAINGAFEASEEIKGKKILLLDDIVTSGTTVSELSSIILKNQPEELLVICASRSNNCNF